MYKTASSSHDLTMDRLRVAQELVDEIIDHPDKPDLVACPSPPLLFTRNTHPSSQVRLCQLEEKAGGCAEGVYPVDIPQRSRRRPDRAAQRRAHLLHRHPLRL